MSSEKESRSIDAVCDAAGRGGLELIALDNTQLTHEQFEVLVQHLRKAGGGNPAMALSLANNVLTDESCRVLREAFREPTFCPSLLTINLRGNDGITSEGHIVLEELCRVRPDLQISSSTGELGAADEVGLEAFRQGAVISEEGLPHARPSEQWTALQECLVELRRGAGTAADPSEPPLAAVLHDGSIGGVRISRLSQVMREICDAVEHEICKEEAIDPAEAQAQNGVVATKKVKLPPGEYCLNAVQQLQLLHGVFAVQPAPVRTAALHRATVGVGSHRFHASALVCALVRCACDEGHNGQVLRQDLVSSGLVSRVAHLAFSYPHCSCLHTAFLDAFSIHTLPHMPPEFWRPLLSPNLGAPCAEGESCLESLPDLLFRQASRALTQSIGERSGLMGMVIQLGRDLHQSCEDNAELSAALETFQGWRKLWTSSPDALDKPAMEGPLVQLVAKQQGSLAGGKPSALSMQGMYEDDCRAANIPLQALLGIREFAQMHQSLNLGVPLQ